MSAEANAGQDFEIGGQVCPSPHFQGKLVVATYNIRYGVGPWLISGGLWRKLGGQTAQPRQAKVRRNLAAAGLALSGRYGFPAPDIIALQEADNCTARSGRLHISLELARELSFQYIHAASRLPKTHPQEAKQWYLDFEEIIGPDDPGDTGISFLSRFPVATAARIDLPWSDCPWRPRLALGASWSLGESAVQVFNAHIDPHAGFDGQLRQHEKILSQVLAADGPVVLMGDFNTLTPKTRRETRLFLENRGFYTPMVNGASTWRTALFTNHTDWIFARNVRILRWGVGRALRSVSDHWPVWAEIALP